MKLSEAIRLGAMLKPQGSGMFLDAAGNSCALGAALDAVGALQAVCYAKEMSERLDLEWPCQRQVVAHPVTGLTGEMAQVIASLNDHHRWTRERIGDFVEQLELAHEPALPLCVPEDTAVRVAVGK